MGLHASCAASRPLTSRLLQTRSLRCPNQPQGPPVGRQQHQGRVCALHPLQPSNPPLLLRDLERRVAPRWRPHPLFPGGVGHRLPQRLSPKVPLHTPRGEVTGRSTRLQSPGPPGWHTPPDRSHAGHSPALHPAPAMSPPHSRHPARCGHRMEETPSGEPAHLCGWCKCRILGVSRSPRVNWDRDSDPSRGS